MQMFLKYKVVIATTCPRKFNIVHNKCVIFELKLQLKLLTFILHMEL